VRVVPFVSTVSGNMFVLNATEAPFVLTERKKENVLHVEIAKDPRNVPMETGNGSARIVKGMAFAVITTISTHARDASRKKKTSRNWDWVI